MTQDLNVIQPNTPHMTRKVSLPKMDLRYFQGVESRADLVAQYGGYADQFKAGAELNIQAIDQEFDQVYAAMVAADHPRLSRVVPRALAVVATAAVAWQGYPLLMDPRYPLIGRLIGAAVVVWALVPTVRKLWNAGNE